MAWLLSWSQQALTFEESGFLRRIRHREQIDRALSPYCSRSAPRPPLRHLHRLKNSSRRRPRGRLVPERWGRSESSFGTNSDRPGSDRRAHGAGAHGARSERPIQREPQRGRAAFRDGRQGRVEVLGMNVGTAGRPGALRPGLPGRVGRAHFGGVNISVSETPNARKGRRADSRRSLPWASWIVAQIPFPRVYRARHGGDGPNSHCGLQRRAGSDQRVLTPYRRRRKTQLSFGLLARPSGATIPCTGGSSHFAPRGIRHVRVGGTLLARLGAAGAVRIRTVLPRENSRVGPERNGERLSRRDPARELVPAELGAKIPPIERHASDNDIVHSSRRRDAEDEPEARGGAEEGESEEKVVAV